MAICGIIIGAATVSEGTDQILDRYGIEGTVFGATIVTAVLTIEDLFLTVRPIRSGVPEIGIGNVIGSLIFSVTGKLGIVVLAGGSVAFGSSVLRWHLPALFVLTGVAAGFMWTGNLKRWHGFVLLALYVGLLGRQLRRLRRRPDRRLTAGWPYSRAAAPKPTCATPRECLRGPHRSAASISSLSSDTVRVSIRQGTRRRTTWSSGAAPDQTGAPEPERNVLIRP